MISDNENSLRLCQQRYFGRIQGNHPVAAPNLKTINPLSRTQLKLQLMRDQALLEQQRQKQERLQRPSHPQHHPPPLTRKPPPSPIKVPLNTIAEVPPQVLQVQTRLENPTKYHVMQKQKNQVKQYLSESFQAPNSAFPDLRSNHQTQSAPTSNGTNVLPNISANIPNITNGHGIYYPQGNTSPNYDVPALSPALSSGATSCTSEVSI
ncbi:hypothetical protein JTB14_034451 [Gonioctena quinquepunctata]|nr:hypothetical protein JTB14_034451 [Gonioctena quinquepunctata]